jgi:hypothetical protein
MFIAIQQQRKVPPLRGGDAVGEYKWCMRTVLFNIKGCLDLINRKNDIAKQWLNLFAISTKNFINN